MLAATLPSCRAAPYQRSRRQRPPAVSNETRKGRCSLGKRFRPTRRSRGPGTPWRRSTRLGRLYPGVGSGAPRVTSARSLAFSQHIPLWSRERFRLLLGARLHRRGLTSDPRWISDLTPLRVDHRPAARGTCLPRRFDPGSLDQSTPGSLLMARTQGVPATPKFDPRPRISKPLGTDAWRTPFISMTKSNTLDEWLCGGGSCQRHVWASGDMLGDGARCSCWR